MAEIDIEKKKPIWPWIILVLIILAILYFLVFADDDNNEDVNNNDIEQVEDTTVWENERDTASWNRENDTLSSISSGGVSGYVAYIGDESRMGVDHEYTNNALQRLIDAVQQKAREQNVEINTQMQEVQEYAQNITDNPAATDHAGNIKNAGAEIASILENIQQENFPDLAEEVDQVRNSVENIDPSIETLQQKDQINSFFQEAADVLQKMS